MLKKIKIEITTATHSVRHFVPRGSTAPEDSAFYYFRFNNSSPQRRISGCRLILFARVVYNVTKKIFDEYYE